MPGSRYTISGSYRTARYLSFLYTSLQKLSDVPHPREVEKALREHRLDEGVDEEDLGGVYEHAHRKDVGGHLVLGGGNSHRTSTERMGVVLGCMNWWRKGGRGQYSKLIANIICEKSLGGASV